ncbi:MAG: hypothetical protein EBR09_12915 [Proteobacteria bacterium]|nr:hypothetical protein [Pseudomonadota bacterium]
MSRHFHCRILLVENCPNLVESGKAKKQSIQYGETVKTFCSKTFSRMTACALAGFVGIASAAGCRKVDSASSNTLATKPSELFSTNSKKRCTDRAAQLSITSAQLNILCERATSSAPVDCFKKKTSQGIAADTAILQCRTPDRPN